MKKRFLFPLLALGVPLSVGISDAAIHSIGCYSGNQGACEELSRRKLFGHEDNITDAKRCVSSKGYAGSCSRVDPQYIPADLVEPFNKAKAAFDVKMAKQKRERAIQAAALVAETKQRAAKAKAEREARGKWTYLSSPDSATGKQSKRAYLTSENSMNFSFPYSGTQYAISQ